MVCPTVILKLHSLHLKTMLQQLQERRACAAWIAALQRRWRWPWQFFGSMSDSNHFWHPICDNVHKEYMTTQKPRCRALGPMIDTYILALHKLIHTASRHTTSHDIKSHPCIAHVRAYINANKRSNMHAYMHVCMQNNVNYIRPRTHKHANSQTCIHAFMHACKHACM